MRRCEAEAAAASLRAQTAAREERMQAEAAGRQAQLQSELDLRTAAAADGDAALAAARGEVTRLSGTVRGWNGTVHQHCCCWHCLQLLPPRSAWGSAATNKACICAPRQVESLRHMGDAAGAQLASAQARIDALKQDKQELEAQVKQLQVRAAAHACAHVRACAYACALVCPCGGFMLNTLAASLLFCAGARHAAGGIARRAAGVEAGRRCRLAGQAPAAAGGVGQGAAAAAAGGCKVAGKGHGAPG